MASAIGHFLLITVLMLVGWANIRCSTTEAPKRKYFLHGTRITWQLIQDMRKNCTTLEHWSSGPLQSFLNIFGQKGGLGSTYIATKTMTDNAMKYTELCINPLMGPIPRLLAFVKWNTDGNFIYPGTKWCGAGNISTNATKYGTGESTDKCCEKHDMATDYMLAEGYHEKSRLKNPYPYTITNCSDDMKLFNCLYEDNSSLSYEFGQVFFDAVHVPCFAHTYPIECIRHTGNWLFGYKCEEYGINNKKPKVWQFLPPPNFFKAYTRKWYNDNFTVTWDDSNAWDLVCKGDPDMGCKNYTFIENFNLRENFSRYAEPKLIASS
ncbi:uncharacterized protein LOC135386262 [Ornithodoros turicata]|uniref:uncharacterized protein LOC135386262 n=1 Tax=Ornithodoros turicata TaxID=34597 RepID=UPI0031389C12